MSEVEFLEGRPTESHDLFLTRGPGRLGHDVLGPVGNEHAIRLELGDELVFGLPSDLALEEDGEGRLDVLSIEHPPERVPVHMGRILTAEDVREKPTLVEYLELLEREVLGKTEQMQRLRIRHGAHRYSPIKRLSLVGSHEC